MPDAPPGSAELAYGAATIADIEAVVALVQAAYRGDAGRAGWTTESHLVKGQRVDATMVAEALDLPHGEVFTARIDGDLVACCELRHRPDRQEVYLGMFAVEPTLQAGGVGRRVLAEAERIGQDRWGARRMVLSVLDVRHELIAWYERRGYARTGGWDEFPYGDERFGAPTRPDLRLVHLAKPLVPAAPQPVG